MPKQRITKEMVVEAAFQLAREGGMEQVLVRNLAARLGCSVQPIYSYCGSMDALRREVFRRVRAFVRDYAAARLDPADPFRSTGRAYLRLAREEPQLFRLFIVQPREGVSSLADLYRRESDPQIAPAVAAQLGLEQTQAAALHLHMLIYTIGLGAVFAAAAPAVPAEEMLAQQDAAYRAFLAQARAEKEETHG